MATYQSVQSNTSTNSTTVVVTKPTGLAVGDWLVAGVVVNRDSGSNQTLSTPSGWTRQEDWQFSAGVAVFAVFIKQADSADVAASNFTFTAPANSTGHMLAHVARVTNGAFVAGSTVSVDSTSGASITASTFTPTRADSLMLGFFYVYDTSIPTTSSFAIATSNPTWTERASNTVNDSTNDSRLTFYTASRPESTATGTVTGTTGSGSSGCVAIAALAPQVNGSVTPTTKLNAYALSPTQSARLDAIAEDPTYRSRRQTNWQNETKPSTTWTNEQK